MNKKIYIFNLFLANSGQAKTGKLRSIFYDCENKSIGF